jgi:o-succinylbenzoate synthase
MAEKIKSVRAHMVEIPLTKVFVTAKKQYDILKFCIAELRTQSGHTGFGETREVTQITGEVAESIMAVINTRLSPVLLGYDPFDIERLHTEMDKALLGNTAAKSAVDMALYDLMGHITGLPLYKLLGGHTRQKVTSSKAVGHDTLPKMLEEAKSLAGQGYKTLKLKTGIDPDAEIIMIREVRRTVGPDIHLKLDANQGWSLPEAVRVLRAVEDQQIQIVEQPLPAWDLKGSAELRRQVSQPIMLDEGIQSPHDAIRIIEAGAADMLNIKLAKTGGIYHALSIVNIAQAAGMACQIGTLDTSIGSAAAAHLTLAKANIHYAEINGPTRFSQDTASGLDFANGEVRVPARPGLGLRVDLSTLI